MFFRTKAENIGCLFSKWAVIVVYFWTVEYCAVLSQ